MFLRFIGLLSFAILPLACSDSSSQDAGIAPVTSTVTTSSPFGLSSSGNAQTSDNATAAGTTPVDVATGEGGDGIGLPNDDDDAIPIDVAAEPNGEGFGLPDDDDDGVDAGPPPVGAPDFLIDDAIVGLWQGSIEEEGEAEEFLLEITFDPFYRVWEYEGDAQTASNEVSPFNCYEVSTYDIQALGDGFYRMTRGEPDTADFTLSITVDGDTLTLLELAGEAVLSLPRVTGVSTEDLNQCDF